MPAITATNSGKDFKQVPPGCYFALCNLVVDLGWQKSEWQGQVKHVHQVYIRWEVPDERVKFERDGEEIEGPCAIGKTYTLSTSPKANLRKDLEGWRGGHAFTAAEEKAFDITKIAGTCCQIMVTHKTVNGKTYANVSTVIGLTAEQKKRARTAQSEVGVVVFSLSDPDEEVASKLPKWLQEKIQQRVAVAEKPADTKVDEEFNDDIPF